MFFFIEEMVYDVIIVGVGLCGFVIVVCMREYIFVVLFIDEEYWCFCFL